jgi:hypothetical protein
MHGTNNNMRLSLVAKGLKGKVMGSLYGIPIYDLPSEMKAIN